MVRRKITAGKKVGRWKDGKYSRYKDSRNPGSGVEWVRRKKPYSHRYGADRTRRKMTIGEGKERTNKRRR